MPESARPRWPVAIAIMVVVAAGALLFARLGHYPLWDDEATTAMFGRNVLKTGDTSARVGHNLIAYRGGRELVDLKMRYLPPMQYYAVAGGAALFGETNFAARAPFAIAGLLTFAVVAAWLLRARVGALTWAGMSMALLCNVSLLLYSRQCRYYGLAIFLSVWAAYLYFHRDGTRRNLALTAVAALALLCANYLSFAALCAVMGADYLLFGRKERRLRWSDWAVLVIPVALLGTPVVWAFNPLGKGIVQVDDVAWLAKRATLLWWNLRDLNACEFGVGILMAVAPILAIVWRDRGLGRACISGAAYVLAIVALSPQPVSVTRVADVRYLIAVIPLCAFIGVRVICLASGRRWWVAIPLMLICFGSNLAHGTWIGGVARSSGSRPPGVRCRIAQYVGEIIEPQRSAFGETADWINTNVPERATVWVMPGYMLYPLMLYAPHPLYGYQLREPVEEQFASLPDLDVHVIGRTPPHYAICFGPQGLAEWRGNEPGLARLGARYEQAATIDVLWAATTRPELFAHEFRTATEFNAELEAVFVFKRSGASQREAASP